MNDWKWTHKLTLELPNGYRNSIITQGHCDSPLKPLMDDWAKHWADKPENEDKEHDR